MRVLFLTNFYPPASHGGYEQWCQEMAEQMRNCGHDVVILTSQYRQEDITQGEPDWIHRDLHLEMDISLSLYNGLQFFTHRKAREQENLSRLRELIKDLNPDAILVWGMWNLHRSLPALAEKLMPGRVAYYIGDYWPTLPSQHKFYWEAPARNWLISVPKRLLKLFAMQVLNREKKPALEFSHVMLPTAFMRDELERKGVAFQNVKIVYGAVDTTLYPFHDRSSNIPQNETLSLLYVGRLTSDKGVHTAIEALGYLVNQKGVKSLKLSIVGDGDSEYKAYLHQLIQQNNIDSLVTFLGAQPKEALPKFYGRADIFLFTSIWPEPFGRVLVEALASGVVVVGTATGGAAEILSENENALFFPPGNAVELATQIVRLAKTPSLRQRLARAGQQAALEKFSANRMAGEIKSYLQEIVC